LKHARLLPLLLCGCINATFTSTEPSFTPHERSGLPRVYVDKLPKRPYESVGIIEVQAPAGTFLYNIWHAAAEKGRSVGCDVVVDRAIHRVSRLDLPRWSAVAHPIIAFGTAPAPLVTTWTAAPPPTVVTTAPPPDKREFVCGVYASAPSRPSAPADAPDETPADDDSPDTGPPSTPQ
jgi:hypothetical protein